MMKKRILISISFLVFCIPVLFPQTVEDNKKSYLVGGINYVTNSVWEGRSDSIVTPYIGTSLGYHFNFGLYVSGELNFYPNRQVNVLDLATVKAGYEFSIIKDVFEGDVSYVKNFYSKYSTEVNSEVQGGVLSEFSYDFDLVKLAIGGAYSYGAQNDFLITSALCKEIEIEIDKTNKLSITPTVTAFAGTQNLYALYLVNRPGKTNHGKNPHAKVQTTTITTTTQTEYSQFNMLDVDVSVPISFVYKTLTFGISPTMAFPIHVQAGEFTNRPFFVNFSVELKL
jgi:hypothetical protein